MSDEKKGICKLRVIPVRREPRDAAEMVTQLLYGESFTVMQKDRNWLQIKADYDGYTGWVDEKQCMLDMDYNTLKDHAITCNVPNNYTLQFEDDVQVPLEAGSLVYILMDEEDEDGMRQTNAELEAHSLSDMENAVLHIEGKEGADDEAAFAEQYLRVPYLWGGKSSAGIDCSGLTQMAFKAMGKYLPRDAKDQEKMGVSISSLSDAERGDLAFFNKGEGAVTHVGILLNESLIIHASGEVKIDPICDEGIVGDGDPMITHKLVSIKRM